MKVLMQSRRDILTKKGGDTVQMLETKRALEKFGLTIDVDCHLNVDLTNYDIVHLFNIDGLSDTYWQAKNAVRQNKPFVLSPIHHQLSDIKIWEDTDRYDFKRFIYPIFQSYSSREIIKNFYKALFNPQEWPNFIKSFTTDILSSQKWVIEKAALVLPNAFGEATAIKTDISPNFKFVVVPNGVSPTFLEADPAPWRRKFGDFSFVLCVGRIESRKNQLRIITALKKVRETRPNLKLVLIGSFNPHHLEYVWRVRQELANNPWILHIPEVPYSEIPSSFAVAQVHVSASWKETTGLVNVEAALSGCGVVAPDKGYCREYLGEEAEYCNPVDVSSIQKAIERALKHKPSADFQKLILRDYTWEAAAKKTLEAYNIILGSGYEIAEERN